MLLGVTALMPAASPDVGPCVTLSGPPDIEVIVEHGPDHAAAVRATMEVEPTSKYLKVLDDLELGVLAQGSSPIKALSHDTIGPGDDLDRRLISVISLPESFRTYINVQHDRLSAAINSLSLVRHEVPSRKQVGELELVRRVNEVLLFGRQCGNGSSAVLVQTKGSQRSFQPSWDRRHRPALALQSVHVHVVLLCEHPGRGFLQGDAIISTVCGRDNLKDDYDANALAKAKDYQSQQSMSPAAIRDQLTSSYDGEFTPAEADFAIANL